ncbi:MAG: NrsF family protein [Erythrobacter sp.]
MTPFEPQSRPQSREALIAALTEDVTPVKRVSALQGATLVAFATFAASLASVVIFGFWTGMVTGEASAMFWIANGLLLLLGAASTSALVASALPRVGARSSAPAWGAAMLGVIPLAALISLFSVEATHDHTAGTFADSTLWYWECTTYGIVAGLLVAIAAIMFLRRGAPVAIERAGWLTGVAAGALGSVAYGITCPLDTIVHVGIVHVAPVAISAVLGRLVVPPLIRW